MGGAGRGGVPGADLLADVAAEDPVPHQLARRLRGSAPAVLDRPVADAAVAVEAVGLGEGAGRAGVQAAGAAPAEVGQRRRPAPGRGRGTARRGGTTSRLPGGAASCSSPPRRAPPAPPARAPGPARCPRSARLTQPGERRGDPGLQSRQPLPHDVVVVAPAGIPGHPRPEVASGSGSPRLLSRRGAYWRATQRTLRAPGKTFAGSSRASTRRVNQSIPAWSPRSSHRRNASPVRRRLQPGHPGAVEPGLESPGLQQVGGRAHPRLHCARTARLLAGAQWQARPGAP